MKNKKNDKLKWIITGFAIVLIIGALIGILANLNGLKTTTNVSSSAYAIGNIDSTTGKYVESRKAIYTKNAYKVKDMIVEIEDNAQISYKLAFYDKDNAFISMTTAQSTDYDTANLPENANYFKVVIVPNQVDGEDVVIRNIFDVSKYAGMLTISCAK